MNQIILRRTIIIACVFPCIILALERQDEYWTSKVVGYGTSDRCTETERQDEYWTSKVVGYGTSDRCTETD